MFPVCGMIAFFSLQSCPMDWYSADYSINPPSGLIACEYRPSSPGAIWEAFSYPYPGSAPNARDCASARPVCPQVTVKSTCRASEEGVTR